MGVGFELVNATKRERVLFSHMPVSTMWEISGHPVAATIVTWYILNRRGDLISFVPDDRSHWPFGSVSPGEAQAFRDVTVEIVQQLVDAGLVVDRGREIVDPTEPEIYIRLLSREWSGSGLPENKT